MKKSEADVETVEYLDARYDRTKQRQRENGVHFNLTRGQYWRLICCHRTALRRINQRYLKWLGGDRGKCFRAGYVLTWKSRQALETRIMDKDTVTFVNADTSKKNCFLKKGDHHSEASKIKISVAKKGVQFTEQHRKAQSEAATRRWARYRAEKEIANA